MRFTLVDFALLTFLAELVFEPYRRVTRRLENARMGNLPPVRAGERRVAPGPASPLHVRVAYALRRRYRSWRAWRRIIRNSGGCRS